MFYKHWRETTCGFVFEGTWFEFEFASPLFEPLFALLPHKTPRKTVVNLFIFFLHPGRSTIFGDVPFYGRFAPPF